MDVSSAASQSFPISVYIGHHEKMSEMVLYEFGWVVEEAVTSTDVKMVTDWLSRLNEDDDYTLSVLTISWQGWQMFLLRNDGFGGLRELYNDWDFVITEMSIYDAMLGSYSIDTYPNFCYVHVKDAAIGTKQMQQDIKDQSHRDFRNAEIALSNGKPIVVWTLPTRIGLDDVTQTLTFTEDLSHNLTELGIPLTLWNIPEAGVLVQDIRLRSRAT